MRTPAKQLKILTDGMTGERINTWLVRQMANGWRLD